MEDQAHYPEKVDGINELSLERNVLSLRSVDQVPHVYMQLS